MSRTFVTSTLARSSLRFAVVPLFLASSWFASSSGAATTNLPPFTVSVSTVTAATLGRTWHHGCPVAPAELRRLRLRYVDFHGHAKEGSIVVNAAVALAVTHVFALLYAHRFPLRSVIPESQFRGSDPASMAADNTSGFNCRYAVANGASVWSVHAYGAAIDVNPVQNPYVFNGVAQPVGGRAYLNRRVHRAGMAVPAGVLTSAFASVGWRWGGRWVDSPDYQHFSATGG